MHFSSRPRMRHRPQMRRPHQLGELPDRSALISRDPRLPLRPPRRPDIVAKHRIDRAGDRIDHNPVAIAYQRDRPAEGGFRPDMANAEPRVPPENRPSVISATCSPMPWP